MQKSALRNSAITPNDNTQGVFWAFLGVGFFSLVYVSGKVSGGQFTAAQLIWFRYLGATICILTWLLINPSDLRKTNSKQVPLHAVRALAGGCGGMAAIYAAANMNVASATAIGLLDGLFTILLGIFLLRELFSRFQWLSAFLCLIGALFIIANSGDLSFDGSGWIVPIVALAGAFLVATESILIKTLARSEPAVSVLLYVSIFGTLIFFIPAMRGWVNLDWSAAAVLLLLGPLALAGQLCNILAFRYSDAAIIGPIRYTWIIWGAVLGWLLFDEWPTLDVAFGGALILFGGLLLARSRASG